MKNTLKGYLLGFLTASILISGGVYAAQTVRIVLNGNEIIPTDVTGKRVDPILVDGTTYLPVRAISTALGLEVGWDEETYTVSLTKPGEVEEQVTEETAPEETENVIEGIAQVTTNNTDKKTSKLWDKKKGKTFTVNGVYELGEWGNYKIVDDNLEYFNIIDHYGWTKAKVVKTGYDNLQRFDPRFHVKFEDDTVLTLWDRKVKINSSWYNTETDNVSEGLYKTIQSAIGIGEIWYQTNEDGYITRIETIR